MLLKCLILDLAALRARPLGLISARGGPSFLFRVVIACIRSHHEGTRGNWAMHSQLVGPSACLSACVLDYRDLPFGNATTFRAFSPRIAASIVLPMVSTARRSRSAS